MNSIKKYIIVLGVFTLVTVIALMIPSIYFHEMDNLIINNVSKDEINLGNIYDNYNLSNLEKIKIMMTDPIQLLGHDTPSEENYTNVIDNLGKELKKIDYTLYKNIYEKINTNYNKLRNFNIETNFLSSKDLDKSIVLRNISIEADSYGLYCLIDVYDNTLLSFTYISNETLFKDLSFDLRENFAKYLEIPSGYVEFFNEPDSISLQITLDKNNKEMEYN